MVLLPCSPCCGPSCESFESRLPYRIETQITQMAVDLLGNDGQCQSQLLASEPFSYWYSKPLSDPGPFFPALVDRDESGDRACTNCRWLRTFAGSNTGEFFADDYIRVDINCSVSDGQLTLFSLAQARIRGTTFVTSGPFSVTAQALSSPAQIESSKTLTCVMFTQPTGCRGAATMEIAWPGLNPLP